MPVVTETDQDQNADSAENQRHRKSEAAGEALRIRGCGQTPLAEEIPDTDPEMKGRGENSDQSKGEKPRILEKMLDFHVGGFAVSEPALRVEMPADINERNESGVALRAVKPIPHPRIRRDVGPAANPDVDAVERMENQRQENSAPFHKRSEWNRLQF